MVICIILTAIILTIQLLVQIKLIAIAIYITKL